MHQFNGRGGHFIDDVAAFDAPFFSVTSKEAKAMDPMQRWTLEASYRAFEKGSKKLAIPPVKTRMGILTAFFLQRASPSRVSEALAPRSFLPPCWKTI